MKKQLLIVGITVLLIAVGLSGCTEEELEELSGGLYVNEEYGFSFNEPDGWIIDNSQSLDTELISFYTSNYRTLISVQWLESVEGKTISNFWPSMVEGLSLSLPDFVLISNNTRTIKELDAYDFVYTYSHQVDDEDVIVKQKSVIIDYKNGEDFIYIVYSVMTPDTYDASISIFEDVLDSFELI